MSKTTKFLSLGLDMMKTSYISASMMEKALLKVEEYLKNKGEFYPEEPESAQGTVKIVVAENAKPIVAEIRFFKKLPGDTFKSDYEAYGRIDMIRMVTGEDGCLVAKIPTGEYLVKISKGSEYEIVYDNISVEKKETVHAYELNRFVNLSNEGYFAGDIHHHSIYSSPVWGGTDDVIESVREVKDSMMAMGLSYGALSDHHNILNHKDWKALRNDDFYTIPSKEISTSNGHVLALGVDEYDVIYRIPEAKERTESYLRNEFVRITDEIRDKGGLPQLNHPRDLSVSISWNRDFYDMTDIFETMEIWNGSNPMYYGSTNSLAGDFWRDCLEKGLFIPATTGSDTHNTRANDYQKLYGKLVWLKEKISCFGAYDYSFFEEEKPILEEFLKIAKEYLPMLEVWAKTSLTSGCVRTYVNLDGKPDTKKVLSALRGGHSFLTNGPILTVKVNGASMGEIASLSDGKADIEVRLLSNRPLTKLTAYVSNKRAIEIPLEKLPKAQSYDYSMKLKDFELGDAKYVFFVASSDVTNMAITNPVLFS